MFNLHVRKTEKQTKRKRKKRKKEKNDKVMLQSLTNNEQIRHRISHVEEGCICNG